MKYVSLLLVICYLLPIKAQDTDWKRFDLKEGVSYLKVMRSKTNVMTSIPNFEEALIKYFFNPQGFLTKVIADDDWQGKYTTLYSYDTTGKLIQEEEFRKHTFTDELDKFTTLYEYNPAGKLICEKEFTNDTLQGITTYSYDPNERELERCYYNNKEELLYRVQNTYTPEGKLAKEIQYDEKEQELTSSYQYDTRGNITEIKVVQANGDFPRRLNFTYTSNDLMATMQQTDDYHKGLVTKFKYRYDKRGNYILKIGKAKGKKAYWEKREIKYYSQKEIDCE